MKSNDEIPEDEMQLAEALNAAWRYGLKHGERVLFRPTGRFCPGVTTHACALGALAIARGTEDDPYAMRANLNLFYVTRSNDYPHDHWTCGNHPDEGESLGWAFRCAMTQEESDPTAEHLLREKAGRG